VLSFILALLNGKLNLQQSNKTLKNNFISSAEITSLSVDLRKGDLDYINKTATSVSTYWYIDCKPYAIDNFKINYNFSVPNSMHIIEALVVASYDPLTTIAPTTNATHSNDPMNVTATVSPNVTISAMSTMPTTIASIAPNTSLIPNTSNKTLPILENDTFLFICKSSIETDMNKVYGYFQQEVNIRGNRIFLYHLYI
jgi:hypothetical protein